MAATQNLQRIARDGLSYQQLLPLIEAALRADAPVLLRGHPGVGKSALAAELAERLHLPLLDLRLAQKDPAELAGIYAPNAARTGLELLPPDWALQLAERPMLLFLDEINAAVTKLHQAAAYQLVLERRVGPVRFHPQTRVLAAGNLDEDRALATPLSTALLNRFVHFRLRVDAADWLQWARDQGLHLGICDYIEAHGRRGAQLLYQNSGQDAFATPRSWAQAARLLATVGKRDGLLLLAASVGPTAAEQYQRWQQLAGKVSPRAIVVDGKLPDLGAAPLNDPSLRLNLLYGVADYLAGEAETDSEPRPERWLQHVAQFLALPDLDVEHAVLFLRRLPVGVRRQLEVSPHFASLAARLVDVQLANLEGEHARAA